MKTVAAIYTTQALIEPTKMLFAELMPGYRLINILDDSLIPEIIAAGNKITVGVKRRFLAYCRASEDANTDLILNTCSSMGDVVDQVQPFIKLPIFKIDEPMLKAAVQTGSTIAVLLTNSSTLVPTLGLVNSVARKLGKEINLIEGLAKGAFQALVQGRPEVHDEILLQTAVELASKADVFVLAQGSMARMETTISGLTGKPVLSSPRLGLLAVKEYLEVH